MKRSQSLSRSVSRYSLVPILVSVSLVLTQTQAFADVGSAMNGYFTDLGIAANATGPTSYQGQSAGYYTPGNAYLRTPVKNLQLYNIQAPRLHAGCNGIDAFAGSFSMVNSAQLISMLKAIANNAVGLVFKVAIDAISPELGKVLAEMQKTAQDYNNNNLNSCDMAEGLVGTLASTTDLTSRAFCKSLGNASGRATDYAAALNNCQDETVHAQTNASAKGADAMNNPDKEQNYTWDALNKSGLFADASGPFDTAMSEYVMNLVGTLIYHPPVPNVSGATIDNISANHSLMSALMDGGTVTIQGCVDTTFCLQLDKAKSVSIPASMALKPMVLKLIDDIVIAIQTDTPITLQQQIFLQQITIPLYKILTVETAAGNGIVDHATLAELAAAQVLFDIMNQTYDEVQKASNKAPDANKSVFENWKTGVQAARNILQARELRTNASIKTVNDLVDKVKAQENVLASDLAPKLVASYRWSAALGPSGL